MKKLSLSEKFKLTTYEIVVKDDWIQFLIGTPELQVLESIVQEKGDSLVLCFLQRKGVSIAERRLLEDSNKDTLTIADIMGEVLVRTEISDEDVIRELILKKRVKINNNDKIYNEETDGDTFTLIKLNNYFNPEEIKEISKTIVSGSGNQVNELIVHFINNRIVDLETNQPTSFDFQIKDIQSLHPDMYQAIVDFVVWELNGYPSGEVEENTNSDPKDLETNQEE